MPNYGLLAQQGRREDNAAMGGQVAHISALESELLRLLGGAGTTNPMTGLPEYYGGYSSGYSGGGQSAAATGSASYGGYGSGGQSSGQTSGQTSGGGGGNPMGFLVGGEPGESSTVSTTTLANALAATQTQAQAQAQATAQAKAKAKSLGYNWADAVTGEYMKTLQAQAKAKGGWGDATMNAIFNLVSKVSPTLIAINAIKGLLGEGGEGGGDGQTQTAASPAISPTYAPLTASLIDTRYRDYPQGNFPELVTLADVIAAAPKPAEGEQFILESDRTALEEGEETRRDLLRLLPNIEGLTPEVASLIQQFAAEELALGSTA